MKKVLVIHPDDRSTDMLKAIYEGKGYDVINDPSISDDEIVEQIKSHDKSIMLGHGTPCGLISWNRATGVDRTYDTASFGKELAGKLAVKRKVHHCLEDLGTRTIQLVKEEDDRFAVFREPERWHEVGLSCLLVLAWKAYEVTRVTHLTQEESHYWHAERAVVLGEYLRLSYSMISYQHDVVRGRCRLEKLLELCDVD